VGALPLCYYCWQALTKTISHAYFSFSICQQQWLDLNPSLWIARCMFYHYATPAGWIFLKLFFKSFLLSKADRERGLTQTVDLWMMK
jgi:hypothetical protein